MIWKRLQLMWRHQKVWFIFAVVMGLLVIMSIWGLANLESFFQQQIVFTLPLEIVKMVGYSVLGAWAFVFLVYRIGMPLGQGSGRKIKGADIKVSFKDVIGLTEAKREAMEVVSRVKHLA